MKIQLVSLIVGVSFALPVSAFAQSSYCDALSHQYQKYVGSQNDRRPQGTPPDVATAMSKCSSDSASAIPVLEQALKNAKVDLPPH
ncbi:MAG TPA: hypothetical protein VMI56_09925 [Reyranella sp.]|nr:hypothetical protein [Reyranella sp.]